MPPNSPSSGVVVPPSEVFPSPPPSVFSSAEGGARVVFGMRIGATAHSAYKAPGLSTSSGARFCGSSGANERYLKGVGRKSACSVDCSVELGDFVKIRRSGLSRIYLKPASQSCRSLEPKVKACHSHYHPQPRDAAPRRVSSEQRCDHVSPAYPRRHGYRCDV
jgi:hypothetical protein